MRILLINSVCGIRSTGRICLELAKNYENEGHEVKIAYGREKVPQDAEKYAIRIGTDFDVKLHGLSSRLFDNSGFGSKNATKKFLKWASNYNPDVLWLHNLHGYYINIELLFNWIKSRNNMEVKWTLHDCWSFTGHCCHFTVVKCDKWKTQCYNCVQKERYPQSWGFDRSLSNYKKKRELFTGVSRMELITPSRWLADLVKQSFLKDYPVKVVYNTIDRSHFKPTPSEFRKKYKIDKSKKIVLGVASSWTDRKGFGDFMELCTMLNDEYVIVMVGLTKKQIETLPKQIIGILRTNSEDELAAIYTAADFFVNPSKEETFGMTTLESLACGTQAIVYKNTACEEVINEFGGVAIQPGAENIYEKITGHKFVNIKSKNLA